MNEDLEKLQEKIEALSAQLERNNTEIAILKTAVERLKSVSSRNTTSKPPRQQSAPLTVFNIENFIGLKLIHFIGIIVLLAGLAIGVKYAIDAKLISPLMRIILSYICSAVLLLLSYRFKNKLFVFSVILFSGAMASAYFTTYAAHEYYSFFSKTVAFILMLLLTVGTVFNSLRYNRQEIAILGLAGAYAIPFFVGDTNSNVSILFAYMFLINLGILFVSFKKYWLPLTYISFFVTWIIFIAAFIYRYRNYDATVFTLYATAYFILFLFNCLAFKFFKKEPVAVVDTFILIADSLFFYCMLSVIRPGSYKTGALLLIVGYCAAALLAKKLQPLQVHLSNTLFAMSFFALAGFIAMNLGGFTVTIVWVLMSVLVFIIGMGAKLKALRMCSIALFAVTLIKLLFTDSALFSDLQKIIAYIFTGAVLLAVSFLYQKFRQQIFSGKDDQGTGS